MATPQRTLELTDKAHIHLGGMWRCPHCTARRGLVILHPNRLATCPVECDCHKIPMAVISGAIRAQL